MNALNVPCRIRRYMAIVSGVSEGLQTLVSLVPPADHDKAFFVAKRLLLDLTAALSQEVNPHG